MEAIWVILWICRILPLLLHSVGFYLLYTKSTNINSSQRIYILNLSVSEMIMCLVSLIRTVIQAYKGTEDVFFQIFYILFYTYSVTYYVFMIFLTLDRLAEIYLNIKYSLYWSSKKTGYLVGATWLATTLATMACLLYFHIARNAAYAMISTSYVIYFSPVTDFIFLAVAAVTYSYIIHKLRSRSRIMPGTTITRSGTRDIEQSGISVDNTTQKSRPRSARLLLPSLLILTFTLTVVLVDVVYFLMTIKVVPNIDTLVYVFGVAFYIGLMLDAICYVMLATTVGRQFLRRVKRRILGS